MISRRECRETEVHSSANNSSDRDRKHTSLDQRNDGPRPPSSDSGSRHWGINIDVWGLEARGITRETASEEKVSRRLSDFFHVFSLWFSLNLQALSIIIGLLGPLVYRLG